MTEEQIFGLARCLCHVYKIYQSQITKEGKTLWLNNLSAYSFSFKQTCDTFYNSNKTASEWLKILSKKGNALKNKNMNLQEEIESLK